MTFTYEVDPYPRKYTQTENEVFTLRLSKVIRQSETDIETLRHTATETPTQQQHTTVNIFI